MTGPLALKNRPDPGRARRVVGILGILFVATGCDGVLGPLRGDVDLGPAVDVFGDEALLSCEDVAELTPLEAARRLEGQGYRIEWRYETSTGPNTGYSDDVPEPPVGTRLTDVVAHAAGVAFVFVSDPGDDQFRPVQQTRCGDPPS